MITQKYLKECVSYDPDTGTLTWMTRPRMHFKTSRGCKIFNTQFSGNEAGGDCRIGKTVYRQIWLDGVRYHGHRLVWLYIYGEFPENGIDHADGDGSNNRRVNLRDVSQRENLKNQRVRSDNTSGVIGVSFDKRRQSWVVQISATDGRKNLGYFSNFEDAVSARKQAEIKYAYHKNHGRTK